MKKLKRQSVEQSDLAYVELLVGDNNDCKLFSVEKELIASRSPVFQAMYYGPLAEKGIVYVPDVTPRAFGVIVEFIHGRSVNLSCDEIACEVLYASKKYLLDDLTSICRRSILRKLSFRNVCRLYEFFELIDEQDLHKACMNIFCMEASAVFHNEDFLNITIITLDKILAMDDLQVKSEIEVLEGAFRWAEQECKRNGLIVSSSIKRNVLGSTFQRIRFLSLRATEIVDSPVVQEVLNRNEYQAILRYMVCKDTNDVPFSISHITRKRHFSNGQSEHNFSYASLSGCPLCGTSLTQPSAYRSNLRCVRCRYF